MKIAQFAEFGPPHEVVSCVEIDELPDPIADEVLLEIEAFPINPADLLTLSGDYAVRPKLPASLGAEGVGRVVQVGPNVRQISIGDRVLPLGRDNWVQRKIEKESNVISLPNMDAHQAAMLKVNPATAWFMLHDYVALQQGDMLLQNAANSGVGMNLIKLAESRGIKTINIVRRPELVPFLQDKYGAFAVLVSGPDIAGQVAEVAGDSSLQLGVDAVGGEATRLLAKCLQPGGTVVNYGLLSGQPCVIDPHDLIFRGITLTGFWLAKTLGASGRDQLEKVYAELSKLVAQNVLHVPVETTYPIDQIKAAVAHAGRYGRSGKIIVLPNQPHAAMNRSVPH